MSVTAEIATDLLTPLGAYLRLREGARAAFLLESVERGRLGRHSFVGRGSRIVNLAEAEALGRPVVGFVGYDVVARFEPTVPLPDEGPGFPESRFVVPDVLVRFDHARGVAEVLVGDAGEAARLLDGPQPDSPRGTDTRGDLRRTRGRASRRAASSCRMCSSGSTTRAAWRRCSSATPTRLRACSTGRNLTRRAAAGPEATYAVSRNVKSICGASNAPRSTSAKATSSRS
jgi:anthranilate/para-aminobenzoate synthase component I